RYKIKC
ncbi:hypothetical protein D043_2009B, partial [Vibrio parahaemolyticus EKP-021]